MLFVPGDSLRKIQKASTLAVDSVILDLEDGVALNQKEAARTTVAEALATLDFGPRERLVRLQTPEVAQAHVDIEATIAGHPNGGCLNGGCLNGYVIPKVENAAQLLAIRHCLDGVEAEHGYPPGSIRLHAMIESARAIMQLREIATATPRLASLIFGSADYGSDLGATATLEGWEFFYARSAIVTAAAAYGLDAIDSVFTNVSMHPATLATLQQECQRARQLGFVGKTLIHPSHVETIRQSFSPSAAEIAHAQRVVAAFAEQQAAGSGAFVLDGKMVDMPILRAAQRVLNAQLTIVN
jgi:citrate lyase beta subunit